MPFIQHLQPEVPDDIWLVIAGNLGLDDLSSICSTCRHLRDLLLNSRTLWREVVEDMLAYSPNATVSQLSRTASVENLRELCIEFRRTYYWLDSRPGAVDLATNQFETFHLPPTTKEARLLPGLSFMVGVSSESSVQLISADTGVVAHTWDDPEPVNITHVQLDICASDQHGAMVLILADYMTDDLEFRRRLWLFTIKTEPTGPRLAPLLMVPTDRYIELVSAHNNTLVYTLEELDHESLTVVNFEGVVDHVAPLDPVVYKLAPTFRNQDINQIKLVSADVFCLFTSDQLALFRIPRAETHSSPLVPYWTTSLDGLDGVVHLGSTRQINENVSALSFCSCLHYFHLRVGVDQLDCELVRHSRAEAPWPPDEEVSVQGRWICTETELHGPLGVRLAPHAFFARQDVPPDRLSRRPDIAAEVQLRLPIDGAELWQVDFDEWTGIVAVQWWRTNEEDELDEPASFTTVIFLARTA